MFHSLIPLKNEQIFKGNVKCKKIYVKRVGNWPLFEIWNQSQKNVGLKKAYFLGHPNSCSCVQNA